MTLNVRKICYVIQVNPTIIEIDKLNKRTTLIYVIIFLLISLNVIFTPQISKIFL